MERGDVPCSSLGADGALLTPPPSSDTSLQELIEAELRTRRAAEPEHTDVEHTEHTEHTEYAEHAEHMSEHTTVTAGLKSSRFVADQPESIMVLKSTRAGERDSDDESGMEVTRVTEVSRQAMAEAAESRQTTTRVTKITEEALSEAMSEVSKVTEEARSEVTEQVTQRVSEESAEFVTEQLTQKTSQQVSENASEYVREQVSQQASQQISQQVSEHVTEQVTEKVSQQVTEQVTEQVTSHVTEEYSEHTSEVNGHVSTEVTRRQSRGEARELLTDSAVDAAETASAHSGSGGDGGSRRSSASSDREPMSDRREEVTAPPPAREEEDVVPAKSVEPQQNLLDLEPEVEAKVEVDVEAEVPLVSVGNSEAVRSRSPERDDAEQQPSVSDANVTAAADDVITTDATDVTTTDVTDEVIETAKVTDEDSDEGVGGGSELRAGSDSAKKLRRKKKSDGADAETGRRRSSFGKEPPPPADHSSRAPHVRSLDSSKAISRFNKDGGETAASSECRSCGRKAFQMESVHAEGSVWHKTCFRCSQCSKHLTVDTYASHEGQLYCVVHHRQLLKAAAAHTTAPVAATAAATSVVDGAAESGSRAADMVQGSDERTDGPATADIVKSSNKADYGLDELQHLNVKDRFSVFERTSGDEQEKTPTSVEVKRSQSILDKMKKFQGRTAARDPDSPDESDGSADEDIPRDPDTVRSSTKKERPIGLATGLGDVKNRFERGAVVTTPEKEQDKGEAAKMRSMICGAREHKLAYEEALREREAQAEAARRHREEPGTVVQVVQ